MKDYAKTEHMGAWLRHPVLGDPSFDTFERLGDTVHRSEPPYEWAVNGSIFRDFDGTWYYYAGLYPYGYVGDIRSRFKIYRSRDEGKSWEDLGFGFEPGYHFEGEKEATDGNPDVVLCYDERHKKYLLTADGASNDFTWELAHSPNGTAENSAYLAWADSPAGPFERFRKRLTSSKKHYGSLGRWDRMYATTVVPREKDYIAFVLCDADQCYAWGLAVMTAPEPEGPWSAPRMVLSCDRPEYYPCPLEFYPAEVHGGVVYASATSVARNRNYQGVFTASLEEAHDPTKWKLSDDGNVWHSHDHPDEYYGIWGQTYHGFVEPDTGRYVVMFPSKDERDYGTLSVAARPWNQPHSDGFTMTAHDGESISPILASYRDFTLDAAFECKGTVEFAFDYQGILGPDDNCADSVPALAALANYTAVRIHAQQCSLIRIAADGGETVLGEAVLAEQAKELQIQRKNGLVSVRVNGESVFEKIQVSKEDAGANPLALVLRVHSRITCSRFQVEGEAEAYTVTYNAADALLGAGQLRPEKKIFALDEELNQNVWKRTETGYVGEGRIAAKWNVIGNRFEIPFEKAPYLGKAGIWIDGCFSGAVNLNGEGTALWQSGNISMGRHAIRVEPLEGRITISTLKVSGEIK